MYCHFHWTLLVAQREGTGQPITWRRYETPSARSMKNLILSRSSWGTCLTLSSSFHHSATLTSSLWAAMPVAAMCCTTWRKKSGFSEESGPQFGLRQGGRTGSRGWRLLAPRSLLSKNSSLMLPTSDWEKFQSEKAKIAEQQEKAKVKLSKLKDITSVAYITAQQQLDKNSVRFTWKNLSQDSVHKVKLLKDSFGRCSKCRWQSGCQSCDAYKCLRYHLHSEAAKAKKLPFLSTGPGDLEQTAQVSHPSYLSKPIFRTYFLELSCICLSNISCSCLKLY